MHPTRSFPRSLSAEERGWKFGAIWIKLRGRWDFLLACSIPYTGARGRGGVTHAMTNLWSLASWFCHFLGYLLAGSLRHNRSNLLGPRLQIHLKLFCSGNSLCSQCTPDSQLPSWVWKARHSIHCFHESRHESLMSDSTNCLIQYQFAKKWNPVLWHGP